MSWQLPPMEEAESRSCGGENAAGSSSGGSENPQRGRVERVGGVRVAGRLHPLRGQHLQADEQNLHTIEPRVRQNQAEGEKLRESRASETPRCCSLRPPPAGGDSLGKEEEKGGETRRDAPIICGLWCVIEAQSASLSRGHEAHHEKAMAPNR